MKSNKNIQFLFYLSLLIKLITSELNCQLKQKFIPNRVILNNRQQLLTTRFNFPIIIDRRDRVVSKDIRNNGVWQSGYTRVIRSMVKQNDFVLNLGSHTGFQALLMGKIVGPKGKIFVFQPYTFSYRIMRKSVYLNNFQDRFITYNIGASDQYQIGTIKVSYQNTGSSQIHQRQAFNENKLKDVPIKNQKIDEIEKVVLNKVGDVLPANIILNYALIDIQKMQIQALSGMKQIIKRSPQLVIFTQWNYGDSSDRDYKLGNQTIQFLFKQGYKFYQISSSKNCTMPFFTQKKSISDLYLKDTNLLLLPKEVSLPYD